MPQLHAKQTPLVNGGPITEYDDEAPRIKSKSKLSKAVNEAGMSLKVVLLLLAVVAVLALSTALVLAFVLLSGEDTGSGGGSPPTQPPITLAPSRAPTQFPTTKSPTTAGDCPTTVLNTEIRGDGDYISLVFPECPSQASFDAFTAAAKRWNGIIAANTIASVSVDFDVEISEFCGFPQSGFVFDANYLFDHLVIFAETLDIDGAGGVLGQAGPCLVDDNFLPVIGGMAFDNADLAGLEADGGIVPVITHEMGHVLGIGSLFPLAKQDGGRAVTQAEALAQDLVFDFYFTGQTFPENRPKFVGTGAIDELETLSGLTEPFVALEDGRDFSDNPFFDTANGEGLGSVDSHWKFTRFIDELMVFQIDTSQPIHPLSAISIASLQDLGYTVDISKADPYTLPLEKKNLRVREPQGNGRIIDLSNDILKTAKDVLAINEVIAAESKKRKLKPSQ